MPQPLKTIIKLVGLVLILLIILYGFGQALGAMRQNETYQEELIQLKAVQEELEAKNDALTLQLDRKAATIDSLLVVTQKTRAVINNLKQQRDAQIHHISRYDVDALYWYFARFNTQDSLPEP